MRKIYLFSVTAAALASASAAHAQVFSVVDTFSTSNPAAFTNWQNAATGAGAVGFGMENFDSYAGEPDDIEISPGSTLSTPSGMDIFFDETADASTSSDALIDISSTSWAGSPPFEGSPAFESFIIVPGGAGSGDNKVLFTFPEPVIGFAGDWDSPTSGGQLTVKIDGDTVVQFANHITQFDDGFLGYVHDEPFTTIEFDAEDVGAAGEIFDVDNVRWATIPTPGALAGVLVGGALLGRRRRRA